MILSAVGEIAYILGFNWGMLWFILGLWGVIMFYLIDLKGILREIQNG